MKNYKLHVTETGRKSGKYHYEVKDQDGNLISERRSNREYQAATIDGEYYFGRRDLVGKGAHGQRLKWHAEKGTTPTPVAYRD